MEPNRRNDACARSRFGGRRFPLCSHRKPVPTGTQRLSSRSWPRVRRQSRPGRRVGRRGRDHGPRPAQVPGASRRGRPGLLGWEGGSTPAEGRAQSVPEAGGTGVDAAANADHAARRSRRRAHPRNGRPLPAGDRSPAREHSATGRLGDVRTPRKWPNSPTANAAGAGVFRGDRRGAAPPLASPCVLPGVGWLDALSLCQASLGTPPKHLSGHRPEQRPPGRRGQAPRPLGRQPQGRRGPYPGAPAARSYSGLPALRPARCATWAMTRCHRSKMVRCCETRRCPLAGRCIQRDAYMGSVPKWFDEGQRRRRLERPQGIPWRQAG